MIIDRDGTAHDVVSGKILGARRIAFHEPFTFRIGEKAALSPGAFGDQATGRVDAAGMKLRELHVLERQASAQGHRVAVTGAGVGSGAGKYTRP